MKSKKILSILLTGLLLAGCDNKDRTPVDPKETCDHKWSAWEVVDDATCVEKGTKTRYCMLCNKTETDDEPVDTIYGHRFVDVEEKLPSYSNKGYSAHVECDLCKNWFDDQGNKIEKSSIELDYAGDELAITVNGIEKATFTKNIIPNQNGGLDVNWTASNVELKVNDTITITKPGSVTTKYAFSGDATLNNDKVATAGTYDITLTSSPEGFLLVFSAVTAHTHSYTENVTAQPTCEGKGSKTLTCACGDTKTEEISELGHDYFLVNARLPDYFYEGCLSHYECSRCKDWFDANKAKIADKSAYTLAKAGDNIAVSINGVQKGTLTLESKDGYASWKYEGLTLAINDIISLNKPDDTATQYRFIVDDNFDADKKSLVAGTYNFTLEATPNGMYLSLVTPEPPAPDAALVIKINNGRDFLNKVTYYDQTTETYIYGYYNFAANDTLIIYNEITNTIYDYDDLADDTTWNVYDFHRGTNGEIVFDTAGKYGIEFDRAGDGKISITKSFAPASEGDFDLVLEGSPMGLPLMSETYPNTSEYYKELAWYANNDVIVNNADNKAAIADGITYYSNTIDLKANNKIKIANVTDENNISYVNADHLVSLHVNDGAITIDGEWIKVNADGKYAVLYMPAFGAIFIYQATSSFDSNIVNAIIKGAGYQYRIDSNNCITIPSAHYDKSTTFMFYKITTSGTEYIEFTMDSSIDSLVASKIEGTEISTFAIYKPGTFTITLNLTTGVVSMVYELDTIQAVGVDPTHNLQITFNYVYGGTSYRPVMTRETNGTVAYLNNIELSQGTMISSVSVLDLTIYESKQFQTLADTANPDIVALEYGFPCIKATGTYNVLFNLTDGTIDVVPSNVISL